MKQIVFILSIFFFFALPAFSQAKKKVGTAVTTPANNLAGKQWVLKSTEKWGVEKEPDAVNKNDKLLMKQDGSFTMTLNGQEKSGTYKKAGAYITFTCEGGEKLSYKVISSDASTLKVDWREDEGLHTIFVYNAK